MLDTNTPAFREQYPNGATVYDRTGRRIGNVIACNPETGEVITYDTSGLTQALLRLVQLNSPKAWRLRLQGARVSWQEGSYGVFNKSDYQLLRRHGFWPAPLRVERIVFNLTVGDAHRFTEGQLITVNNVSYAVASVTHNTITP
jgi:hypothetical protein